jgi:hypothetical protein
MKKGERYSSGGPGEKNKLTIIFSNTIQYNDNTMTMTRHYELEYHNSFVR